MSERNGSRLAVPGQVPVEFSLNPGPFVDPAVVVIPRPSGGVNVVGVMGFHKLEDAALRIAAGMVAGGYYEPEVIGQGSVEIAKSVLASCAAAISDASAPQQQNPEQPGEAA